METEWKSGAASQIAHFYTNLRRLKVQVQASGNKDEGDKVTDRGMKNYADADEILSCSKAPGYTITLFKLSKMFI